MSHNRLRSSDITLFCTQTALFLRAGVPLLEGLALMKEELGAPALQNAIAAVCGGVERRESFSQAIREAGVFPAHLERMVRVGETAGQLDEIMSTLADFYEREEALKQRVRSSVTYPVLLILMMAAVVALLIANVLPLFGDLLRDQGEELPGLARGLIAFGQFAGRFWWAAAAVVLAILMGLYLLRRAPKGRAALDQCKATFFLTRTLTRKIAAERFATAMAFLLRSGVPAETALGLSGDLLDNAYVAQKLALCRDRVAQGDNLPDALCAAGIFPRLFTRMLSAGFKTGDLDGMMARLAERYEAEVDTALGRLIGAIEPAFVALLSIVVGGILVSVMLPLMRIMAAIG
ncbi:MAG: type II secretion system F family protein [Oscillospiraceae bacterium]|nr:type II secretion system F family protein [Oscillospiraceae bacterium]